MKFESKGRLLLGGNFNADDCELCFGRGSEVLMTAASLKRCKLVSETTKAGRAQHQVLFDGCAFRGTFHGWKFGGRGGAAPLVNCDFLHADLHDTELYDCELADQCFAGWPTIVFVDPQTNAQALQRASWPKKAEVSIWLNSMLAFPCSGFVVNGHLAAKAMRIETETLRESVRGLGSVVLM